MGVSRKSLVIKVSRLNDLARDVNISRVALSILPLPTEFQSTVFLDSLFRAISITRTVRVNDPVLGGAKEA